MPEPVVSALGYLRTGKARAKVHQWFSRKHGLIADGRAVLDKEFRRLAVDDLDYETRAYASI